MGNPPAHRARKRFGQNFLHDTRIIDQIIRQIAPQADDALVEIGPGLGALTGPLLEQCDRLTVIELDRDLVARLRQHRFADRLTIIGGDALKVDFAALATDRKLRVVGNLPYNISTPLLFHLLAARHCLQDMHFMLQREVVERLGAEPGNRDYGRLSVMFQSFCTVEAVLQVPPSAFRPEPKVHSAVVRLIPDSQAPADQIGVRFRQLEQLVQLAFATRRKTLRNCFRGKVADDLLEKNGIDPGARAETVPVRKFVQLAADLEP